MAKVGNLRPTFAAVRAFRKQRHRGFDRNFVAPTAWSTRNGNDPTTPEAMRYHAVPTATRMEYAFLYLGLAAVLALLAYNVHQGLRH